MGPRWTWGARGSRLDQSDDHWTTFTADDRPVRRTMTGVMRIFPSLDNRQCDESVQWMKPSFSEPLLATHFGPGIALSAVRKNAAFLSSWDGPNAATCNGFVTKARASTIEMSAASEGE